MKNPAAVSLGRRGGIASAAALTAEQRIARAKRAGRAKRLKCECGHCPTCYQREYKRRKRGAK